MSYPLYIGFRFAEGQPSLTFEADPVGGTRKERVLGDEESANGRDEEGGRDRSGRKALLRERGRCDGSRIEGASSKSR